MPIMVVATGRVAEQPRPLLGEDSWTVFILSDPFPGSPGSRLAHACEVVCQARMAEGTRELDRDDRVEVTGELLMAGSWDRSRTTSAPSACGSRRPDFRSD